MFVEAILSTVIGSAISGVIGNRTDNIATDTMIRIVNNFNKNKRLINHDLQKAVLCSYYLALKSICEECLDIDTEDKRVKLWLEYEVEDIQSILKRIEKDEYNFLPIEELDQIRLLITTEQSVADRIAIEKDKLIFYALDKECPPRCYTSLVKNTFYQRICGFFAFEIKNNQIINNIFQSQLLSNIDIKVSQLVDCLMSDVSVCLPEFREALVKIEHMMKEGNKSFEEYKLLYIGISNTTSSKLDEILKLLNNEKTKKKMTIENSENSVTIGGISNVYALGLTFEAFLDRLIFIDYKTMSGLTVETEGTSKQWAAVFENHPETWRILIIDNEIVGYWHFVALYNDGFAKAKNGWILENEITEENVNFMMLPGKYKCFISAIAILPQYRTVTNFSLLIDAFIQQLIEFAKKGIYISELCTNAFTNEGISLCKTLGMKYLCDHSIKGKIYYKKFIPLPNLAIFTRHSEIFQYFDHG